MNLNINLSPGFAFLEVKSTLRLCLRIGLSLGLMAWPHLSNSVIGPSWTRSTAEWVLFHKDWIAVRGEGTFLKCTGRGYDNLKVLYNPRS